MTVAEDATDAEFTFHERLVCANHRETSLWLALLAGIQWTGSVLEVIGRFDSL